MSKKPKSIVQTEPLDILFMQWVRTLPRESLPDLLRALQAYATGTAPQARAAMLKFLRAAGYPDAKRRAAEMMRSSLRVVGE